MIYLEGLPEPPSRNGWWDPTLLAQYIAEAIGAFRHQALEMRDTGGTKEDWEYMAELTKALALRAWEEISGPRPKRE